MAEQMDIIVVDQLNHVEVRQVDKPKPGKRQVVVAVEGCALCTFEQRQFTGEAKVPLPFIGGHEVACHIAELGEGVDPEEFPVGKRVAVRTFHSCGRCYPCRHDEGNLCEHNQEGLSDWLAYPGTGGLQQYMLCDLNQLYNLSDEIPTEKACFAEPLACVLNSIEKGHIEFGSDVVVIGGGIMGQLHVMCAKKSGARVIMSEPDEARRKLALELGADDAIDPTACDAVETIKQMTDGNGASVVFNTTAVSAVAQQAIGMVAKLGTVVMYSSQHPDRPIEVSPGWLHNSEANITGAVSPSVRSFRRSCEALNKGIIDPTPLLSGVFDYHDCQQAFETACRPDTFRCVVKFQ